MPDDGRSFATRPWFADRLACPDCTVALALVDGAAEITCEQCGRRFPIRNGQLHCVVDESVVATVHAPVRQRDVAWPAWSEPPQGYAGPLRPRTNGRHLSVLANAARSLDVLDWGCGRAESRSLVADVLGHRYVGVDIAGDAADVIADVHRLPFAPGSFDHVITNATLEHVANPFVAVAEIARVLRTGGRFVGCVAFMEPHHCASRFHVTADGIVHVLTSAGLVVDGIWPQEGWTVFESLASMPGPLSSPTRLVLRFLGLVEPLLRARHLHPREIRRHRWLQRKTPENVRRERLFIAGQVDFLATKPALPA